MMPIVFRIDAETLPALIFALVLLIIATAFAVYVWRVRQSLEPALESDPATKLHANRQFRRRMQVSVMLGLVAILIVVGDQFDQFLGKHPMWFLVWLFCILVLTAWTVLMGLGDWLSTFAYTAIARSNLRHERSQLEAEIRRYHASQNGHSFDHPDQSN